MIIVTGGAGMIGSNLIGELNKRGVNDIIVVDDLSNGKKFFNLAGKKISDYFDRDDFFHAIRNGYNLGFGSVKAVFHLGACSSTTEWDGRYLMNNNYQCSKDLLLWCQEQAAQFIYASSASVYGLGESGFFEDQSCEHPLNMYAYSKLMFDEYVRKRIDQFEM